VDVLDWMQAAAVDLTAQQIVLERHQWAPDMKCYAVTSIPSILRAYIRKDEIKFIALSASADAEYKARIGSPEASMQHPALSAVR
jgi:hypothetical protein